MRLLLLWHVLHRIALESRWSPVVLVLAKMRCAAQLALKAITGLEGGGQAERPNAPARSHHRNCESDVGVADGITGGLQRSDDRQTARVQAVMCSREPRRAG